MRGIAFYQAFPHETAALIHVTIKELEKCGLSVTFLRSPSLHCACDGAELLLHAYPTALQDESQPAGWWSLIFRLAF